MDHAARIATASALVVATCLPALALSRTSARERVVEDAGYVATSVSPDDATNPSKAVPHVRRRPLPDPPGKPAVPAR